MKHPTYGGLKKVQEYCLAAGFPLEVCRGEIFDSTLHCRDGLRPLEREFTLRGVDVDLKEKVENEPWTIVGNISLTHFESLYQLIFFTLPKSVNSMSVDIKDSYAFLHPRISDQSQESRRFRVWVMQHHRDLQKIAWCGMANFSIPDFYNFYFKPEKYVKQVFLS